MSSVMLVKRAEEFAKLVHRNQTYGGLRYYVHLKEVYLTLLDFGVTDENILAASWLHDSIEDTSTTYETLRIQFGEEVADLVLAVTNEKGTSRKEILEKTAPKIRDNEAALVIKLADRIVNTEFSIDSNKKLYKMYEKEFPLFQELLGSREDYLNPMWIYLQHLYLGEAFRFTVPQAFEMAETMLNMHEMFQAISNVLEERELLDEREMQVTEYREELREVERERKEDEYWNQYNQMLDEREARYYDDCYQIVEEKMYDI